MPAGGNRRSTITDQGVLRITPLTMGTLALLHLDPDFAQMPMEVLNMSKGEFETSLARYRLAPPEPPCIEFNAYPAERRAYHAIRIYPRISIDFTISPEGVSFYPAAAPDFKVGQAIFISQQNGDKLISEPCLPADQILKRLDEAGAIASISLHLPPDDPTESDWPGVEDCHDNPDCQDPIDE